MEVGLLNVEGIGGTSAATELIPRIMHMHQLDVLVLTETWLPHTATLKIQDIQCYLSDTPYVEKANRHQGGVMICVRTPLSVRLAGGVCTPAYQALTITCYHPTLREEVTISGVYASPRCSPEELSKLLRHLHASSGHAAIIAGDFNARHTDWDSVRNPRGDILRTFILRQHYRTAIPNAPTYRSSHGTSTVDLSVCRGLYTVCCLIKHGSWDHRTHHRLAITRYKCRPAGTLRIPRSVTEDQAIRSKVSAHYTNVLPRLTSMVRGALNENELEQAMNELLREIIQPWLPHTRRRPQRFRPGWNFKLEAQDRLRRKLLRQAARYDDDTIRARAKILDKEIKRTYRKNRRRLLRKALDEACNAEAGEANRMIQMALKRFGMAVDVADTSPINPATYTRYLHSTQRKDEAQVRVTQFYPVAELREEIVAAIRRGKLGKAPGADGVTFDMLRLTPKYFGNLLFEVWAAIGRTEYMPQILREGIAVPLYKKGDVRRPENYRPIMLLSHLRKAVSSALNVIITREYSFHPNQWGFRKHTGTEHAIVHAHNEITRGHNQVAVLDLRRAYDTVPRQKLAELYTLRLGNSLATMIDPLLVPMTVRTKGQEAEDEPMSMVCGVPQGDAISPTLYNIFMDPLLEQVCAKYPNGLSCYCDDTTGLAANVVTLQQILDEVSNWAEDNGMSWNAKKSSTMADVPVTLAGEVLHNAIEVQYLGVSLTREGVTDTRLKQRIRTAGFVLHTLMKASRQVSLSPIQKYRVFRSQVISRIDYALPCTPFSEDGTRACKAIEERGLAWCLGQPPKGVKDMARAAALLGFPPIEYRQVTLGWRLVARLLHIIQAGEEGGRAARRDALMAQRVLVSYGRMRHTPMEPIWAQRIRWLQEECTNRIEEAWRLQINKANRHKTRPLPNSKRRQAVPVLRAGLTPRAQYLAVRWYLYKLPTPLTPLDKPHQETLKECLQAATLTKARKRRVITALQGVHLPRRQATGKGQQRKRCPTDERTRRAEERSPANKLRGGEMVKAAKETVGDRTEAHGRRSNTAQ